MRCVTVSETEVFCVDVRKGEYYEKESIGCFDVLFALRSVDGWLRKERGAAGG